MKGQARLIKWLVAYFIFCLFLIGVSVSFGQDVPVNFQWNASTGDVWGYELYQGTTSGQYQPSKTKDLPVPLDPITQLPLPGSGTTGTMMMDTDFPRYVVADAYDSKKRRSAFSNEILCHPVLTSCEAGGTINPGGPFFVQDGRSVVFGISPGTGNMVNNVLVNGASQGPLQVLTLSAVDRRTTVAVDLEPTPKVVTYTLTTVTPTTATDPIVVELPNTGAAEYELRAFSFERKVYQAFGASTLLTRQITLSKAGHYLIEYRGCTGTGTGRSCTAWVSSNDPQYGPRTRKEDGSLITQGWWVYQYVRAPGPIVVQ